MSVVFDVMIGVRSRTRDEIKRAIQEIREELREEPDELFPEGYSPLDRLDLSHCLSSELEGGKGSIVVLAGRFNAWNDSNLFAEKLSSKLKAIVFHWNHDGDTQLHADVFERGKQYSHSVYFGDTLLSIF